MNVNEKGAMGLIEVIRDLTKKGYECFTPIHDYSRVDLIALDINKNPLRLQVKYRTRFRNNIEIGFHTVVNGKKVPIDLSAIDGWAVYCPEIDKVVYVSKHEVDLDRGGFCFKLEVGKRDIPSTGIKYLQYHEYGDITEWRVG